MKDIQPFIDLGWHTVPLKGELKRLDNGDKTIPQFEKDWRKKYRSKANNLASKLGGTITGKESGIIAIDCDNTVTYNLFKMLDPNYEAVFVSKGKKKDAGTFIYSYNQDMPDSFSPTDRDIELDVYSGNGFVYLPTAINKTKVPWTKMHDIKEMPETTLLLLKQLQKKVSKPKEAYVQMSQNRACLAPLLQQFCGSQGQFMPSLFKILTPKSFRTEEQYRMNGYLHPDNVPDGRGSEYLVKLSAILGADESVNEELYIDCMSHINELFENPLDEDRFEITIINPMLEGNSTANGEQIWTYNKHWSEKRYTLTTKHGLVIDIAFDDQRNMYYFLDMTNESLKSFNKDTEFMSYLEVTVNTVLPKKAILKKKLPIVRIQSDPAAAFGFCKSDTPQVLAFNSFKASPELSILHDPTNYSLFYNKPENTLKYLKCLVPNEDARSYLLRFIKRKLMTFEYSPVILYFLGVPGSGKDTFVKILETIMNGLARPTTGEFLEVYNSWMLDTYFVQLDEYGDQLSKLSDKDMVKGKLKAYTGKPTFQVRNMRQAGYSVPHSITFIMTANKNPLMMDDKDRRVHLMETPNVLDMQPWFSAAMYDHMMNEVKDFCYYLATEVEEMNKDEYMSPPQSESKHRLIADSMFAAQKIVYAMKHHMWDYLIELGTDYNAPKFAKGVEDGRFNSVDLELLYDEMTDFKGDVKTVIKILRKEGFLGQPSTKEGQKCYWYNLHVDPFEGTEV